MTYEIWNDEIRCDASKMTQNFVLLEPTFTFKSFGFR